MWWYHIANPTSHYVAAKAALRRKKAHERSLEQTRAQVMQIEQQIYSIEAANINQETLNAMKNAGSAMKLIHSGLTIEKVDATMYVWNILTCPHRKILDCRSGTGLTDAAKPNRDELREQQALSEEIVNAITNASLGEPADEEELEAELEGMEQERIDEQMLKTGTMPVATRLDGLPAAANGEREFTFFWASPPPNIRLPWAFYSGLGVLIAYF